MDKSELQSKLSSQLFPQLLLPELLQFHPYDVSHLTTLNIWEWKIRERGALVLAMHYSQKRDFEGTQR